MAISDSQKVDLLYKKLFGVSKTDLPGNKGAGNEPIASPALNRGDKIWSQAGEIPATAASVPGVVEAYLTTNRIECVADNTTVAVSSVFPTWKTNLPDWIPPEFGSTYSVSVYAQPTGNANPTNDTPLSDAGSGGTGEWFFDYQSGTLNFIGGTIPAALTASKVVYVTGYRYVGLKGGSQLASANISGNISAGNVTVTGTLVANSLVIPGLNLQSLVSSNFSTNTATAQTIVSNSIAANIWTGIYTSNVIESASNLYYTNERVYANVAPLLATKANVADLTTANVVELNNLYYSNARVYSNLSLANINVLADVEALNPIVGQVLVWSGNAWIANSVTIPSTEFSNIANTVIGVVSASLTANVANTVLTLSNFTTANLAEGTNLYYTNARVNAQVESNLRLKANVADLTTANVAELNNLYYTNARVLSNVAQMSINVFADVDITGIGNNGTLIWNGTSFIAGVSATATESNFANTAGVSNVALVANFANVAGTANVALVANFANAAGTSNVANTVLSLSNFTTANLAESTNLYYTNARVYSNVILSLPTYTGNVGAGNVTIGSGTGGAIIGANLISANNISATNWLNLYTANVAEVNNLYYTNARVLSNVTQMSINVFADVDISNIQTNDTLIWDGTKFIKALAGQSTAIVANITTTGNVEITRFNISAYSTVKYVYTVKGTSVGYTSKYNSGELLVMHDDTSSFITQYAMLSNDNNLDLLSFQAGINNGNVIIYGNVSDPAIQVTVKLTGATYTAK